MVLVLLGATAARAAEADGVVTIRRRRAVSREMKDLGRAQREEFLGLAVGAAVGIAAAAVLSAVWRRSPLVARALAGAGLAAATTALLGLWLVTGRVSPAIAGSGIAWLLLTATLIWVFRPPAATRSKKSKKSLAWLRVASSRGTAAGRTRDRGRRGASNEKGGLRTSDFGELSRAASSVRPPAASSPQAVEPRAQPSRAERPEVDDALVHAEAEMASALEALEGGDAEAALAGLRRSIDLRPTKRAHTFLGTVLGARGEREEALKALDGALELDPAYGEALDEKARILEGLGRAGEAAAVREKAKGSAPRLPAEGAKATRRPDLSRSRRAARLTAASGVRTLAPWIPAAAFSGAVVAGTLLSLVYAAGREWAAARGVISVLEDAEAGLSAPSGGDAPSVRDLQRRRLDVIRRNPFARDRAASLKAALALHACARAKELEELEGLDGLEGEDAGLSRWAAGWARRRIAEALAALAAGDRTRLPMGLANAFAAQREDFERELERRRRILADASGRTGGGPARVALARPSPGGKTARDWRGIWRRPAPGTTFMVEAFTRTSLTAKGERAAVGTHGDGSPLAAVGLLRCTVAPSPPAEPADKKGGAFVLLVDSLPFGVEYLDEPPPDGMPPDVLLLPKEGERVAGPFRMEFGPRLEFRSLASLADGKEEPIVSRADLYAARAIPFKSLPIFAPGLGPRWEEDESYFSPYEGAVTGEGPLVKQVTHWKTVGGVTRIRVGWRTRYMRKTKEYSEQVVQAWTPSDPWWDFYDDGELFFRTVFRPGEGESGKGRDE